MNEAITRKQKTEEKCKLYVKSILSSCMESSKVIKRQNINLCECIDAYEK